MAALHKALHIERVVIVTPSVYGPDNSATLFGIKARGATARGVAVIDDKTPESDLDAMNEAGIRGIRLNLATGGVSDPDIGRPRFQAAVDRVKSTQLACPDVHQPRHDFRRSRIWSRPRRCRSCSIISAAPRPRLASEQPGFADLLALVQSGKAYVKISGAYRASTLAPDYPDVVPLARALIAANADRIIWGTDWPHPNSATPPGRKPTDVTPLLQSTTAACSTSLRCGRRMRRSARGSWSTIRRGFTDSEYRSPRRTLRRRGSRPLCAQPAAGLAQPAERKQMEAGDRRRRGRRRRLQAAHDVIRPGIGQQPAEAADLAAQRPHRIADAAAEREFHQRRRRRRTGEADDDGQVDARAPQG